VALFRQFTGRHWFFPESLSEWMDDCEIIHPTAHSELLQPFIQSTRPAGGFPKPSRITHIARLSKPAITS
jgi:hypothetical protein